MTAAGTVYALMCMLMLVSLPLPLGADGLNPADAGLIMTVSTLALVVARPLMRARPLVEIPTGAAFAAGYVLIAGGLAGYAVAHTLPALIAPTVAWSLGNLLLMGRAFAVIADLAPPGATTRYLTVYGLSWGFATVAAPLIGTWLIGAFGPGTLWATMSAVCLAMALAQPALLRRLNALRSHASPHQVAVQALPISRAEQESTGDVRDAHDFGGHVTGSATELIQTDESGRSDSNP